jgi:hypothetical protein
MMPSAQTLRALAADLGISLSERHLTEAAKAHGRLRPELEALRQVSVPYLDEIEPATALQWINSGGRPSAARSVWNE